MWKLWIFLGWNDIRMRYRGSILGPFWITASMLIFISAFALVYSRLFHQSLTEYIPFLTAGYLAWMLISSMLTESCNIFTDSAPFITEIKLPYMLYILRLAWRQIIILSHNAVVFVLVALVFRVHFDVHLLYFIPGLLLFILNLTAVSLLLAMLGTKYRDVQQALISVIQVAFFITPISWKPELLANRRN
jgi:ABC-2 type transport system permease protein/lipopolysaccharide transport system permease protein